MQGLHGRTQVPQRPIAAGSRGPGQEGGPGDRGTGTDGAAVQRCGAPATPGLSEAQPGGPTRPPARRSHLGTGRLPLGPALRHRLLTRAASHGRVGSRGDGRPPPDTLEPAGESYAGLRFPTAETARTAHAEPQGRAPCWTGGVSAREQPPGAKAEGQPGAPSSQIKLSKTQAFASGVVAYIGNLSTAG